ncbi:MocR-like pyridoxine biosynthesis transcription factor PdxR [Paenibacillus marchantiophytorum]|nr:PLP-dependent aminotransferase family protein [Paenibacillus marchantiophytorum]
MEFHLPYDAYRMKYASKYAALYHALHDEILESRLPLHTKLPSSRELARLFGLSRGTVNQVYEMLIAEGYLQADVGRGTYVVYASGQRKKDELEEQAIRLSDWGERVRAEERGRGQGKEPDCPDHISFRMGHPHLDEFPRELWNRGMYEQVRRMTESPQEEAFAAEGHEALRLAIAQHLRRMRGIDAPPERIVIVNGSMQAIALLTQVLVNADDPVVVERPGYQGATRAVLAAGGVPIHAEVDGQGLVPQPWNARLLFVTPSRQFPTGAVLGLERRQQLLRWAAEQGAVIVEDDYDSEFRHRGRPIEPLKVLDQEGRVVYIGTFSITMLQELRIGYVVLPKALVGAFVAAKRLFEPHPSGLLEQRSLATFMASGGYERHLRRMRRVYASKFLLLQGLLQERMSTRFDWVESDAGLHLFGWWRGNAASYASYAAECREAGVTWSDAASYGLPPGRAGACFSFAHLTEDEIRRGVQLLR